MSQWPTPPIRIHDAVRIGLQVEESTGRWMDSAWLLALPVKVAVAQMKAENADIGVMDERSRRPDRIALPVITVDIDAIHRKVPA